MGHSANRNCCTLFVRHLFVCFVFKLIEQLSNEIVNDDFSVFEFTFDFVDRSMLDANDDERFFHRRNKSESPE